MDTNFNIIFNFILEQYGTHNIFWILYVINLILSIIAYKLGFARDLPPLKSFIVYVLLAVGTYISTIFSILQFPITETLIIVSIVLAIYRWRLHRERQANK